MFWQECAARCIAAPRDGLACFLLPLAHQKSSRHGRHAGSFSKQKSQKAPAQHIRAAICRRKKRAFTPLSGGAPGFQLRAALKMKKLFGFFCDILNDRTGEQNRDDCACAKLPAEQNANDDKKNV